LNHLNLSVKLAMQMPVHPPSTTFIHGETPDENFNSLLHAWV